MAFNKEQKRIWRQQKRAEIYAYNKAWKLANPDKVSAIKERAKKKYDTESAANIAAGLTADGRPRKAAILSNLSPEEKRSRQRAQAKASQSKPENRIKARKRNKLRDKKRYGTPEYRDYFNSVRKARRKASNPTLATIREKILDTIRGRVLNAIQRRESRANLESIIGCSITQLREHLQSQFIRHMSWNNHGTVWHIDHIVPCSYFDLDNPEEIKRCWHFSNLRPLWAKKNMKDKDKRGHMTPSLCI